MSNPELINYLRAGTPCLFLLSIDEEAVTAKIKEVLCELGENGNPTSDFGVWKSTTGLQIYPAAGYKLLPKKGPRDIGPALQEVEKSVRSIVAVFFNVRSYLDGSLPNTQLIIQQLRDTILKARTMFSAVILAGPFIELPPELHDVVTFCSFPLPTQKQLEQSFAKLIKKYIKELKNFPADKEERRSLVRRAASAAMGLSSLAAENALALSLSMTGGVDIPIIQRQKEQDIKKSDVLEYIPTTESLDSLGGFGALKNWLGRRKAAFTEEAQEFGLSWPKGILLAGVPGSGKSLCAKVIASYLELPLLRLDMGRVYSSYVGSSEQRIRTALHIAEAVSPAIIWVDELERGLAGAGSSNDSGVTSRVIATLLTWRQETKYPVFLVGTINNPFQLPQMVYRKDRFDEIWAVDVPDQQERLEILKIHLIKRRRNPENFDLNTLVLRSNLFTGAEIESCIEDALFTAFAENTDLTTELIIQSINNTKPQTGSDDEEINALRSWMATKARRVSIYEDFIIPIDRRLNK
jgi:hypothetical protein